MSATYTSENAALIAARVRFPRAPIIRTRPVRWFEGRRNRLEVEIWRKGRWTLLSDRALDVLLTESPSVLIRRSRQGWHLDYEAPGCLEPTNTEGSR